MPDRSGRIRGIAVPRVPWHDDAPELHVCPGCGRAFSSPSVCMADGSSTVPVRRRVLRGSEMVETAGAPERETR